MHTKNVLENVFFTSTKFDLRVKKTRTFLGQFQKYLKKFLFSLSKMIFIQFAYMEII